MKSSLRGLTILTTRSVYLNISSIISCSFAGGGLSSGCEHGCTIPLKSRYKLSNSTLFGFGCVVSTGTTTPPTSRGESSVTRDIILGYFLLSQRKAAGTLGINLSIYFTNYTPCREWQCKAIVQELNPCDDLFISCCITRTERDEDEEEEGVRSVNIKVAD